MLKKYAFPLLGCILLSGTLSAAGPDGRKRLTTNRLLFGLTSVNLHDGYLSNELYSGTGMQLNYATTRYPSRLQTNLYLQQELEIMSTAISNEAGTASISYTNLQYAWGTMFPLKSILGVKPSIGPMLGASLGARIHSRNVNNPYNFDLLTEVLFAGSLTYDLPVRSRDMRLKANLRVPVLGCQFAPVRGLSYYEMLTFGQYDDVFHLTSFHNKNAWHMQYSVDIPLNAVVVSFGVTGNYALFSVDDWMLKQQSWAFQIGCTFDVLLFSGARRPNPDQYLYLDR